MKGWLLVLVLGCFVLHACRQPTPQLPANKVKSNANNDTQTLIDLNKNLAAKEDSALKEFVEKHFSGYSKSSLGFWYKIENVHAQGAYVQPKEMFTYQYELKSLDEKILENGISQATFGKKELITGLEEGIKMLKKGESATFIIPSYIAYGRRGKDEMVPPFTPVVYKIKLFESSCKSN